MSRRTGLVMGVAVLILFAIAGMTVRRSLHRPPHVAVARHGEVTVDDALRRTITEGVVRGYVVDFGFGPGFPPRLCAGITRRHPPDCLAPFLELASLDVNRLVMKTAKDAKGRTVVWTPNPVSIAGKRRAGTLTVVDILP